MRYATAQFPTGARVLGIQLLPLTLGHALLLARINSPLVPDGPRREPLAGDASMLLWVCSRPWEVSFRTLNGRLSRWRRALLAGRCRLVLSEVLAGIEAYLLDQMTGPRIRSGGDGEKLRSPTLALIKVAGMAELGLTEREVLDRPLALTLWETVVAAERRGGLRVDNFDFLLSAAREFEATGSVSGLGKPEPATGGSR